jgi:glycogen debranching enzyme
VTGVDLEPGSLPPPTGATLTLVQGRSFVICGAGGDIEDGIHGVFVGDTRIGSRLVVTVDDRRIECLATTSDEPFHAAFVGRTEEDSLVLFRDYWVGLGLRCDLRIHNPAPSRRTAIVAIELASDLASLFDVKAIRPVAPAVAANAEDGSVRFGSPEADRGAVVQVTPSPEVNRGDTLRWQVDVAPHEDWHCCLEWSAVLGGIDVALRHRCGAAPAAAEPAAQQSQWRVARPRLSSDIQGLEHIYRRTIEDIGALRIFDVDPPDEPVVAAGAPWFMTLFGRDSILTSWMSLLIDSDLAVATARVLGRLQGRRFEAITEEQPGRILHEVRSTASSSLLLEEGEVYYGSVDATPLYVMLVDELWRWGAPLEVVRPLLPHVDAALDWMAGAGDVDGDGYLEYLRATPKGLANQGWKDSGDSIHFADGRLARAPVALCEVQGYAYAAWLAGADLARAVGDEKRAAWREERAAELRRAFNRDFWLPHRDAFALALDRDKRPADSIASNMGHCLWTGIVDADHAASVARWLTGPDMASGWGLRTLAQSMARYDPLSYHNGSVWPHDTAIAIAGLRRAGFVDEALFLATQLLDAAHTCEARLPELYSGMTPRDFAVPVPYPTSCSPQAWASAAPLLVLRALLGLEPNVPAGTVALDPVMLPGTSRLRLEGVPLAGGAVTIDVDGGDVTVDGMPGPLVLAG